MRGPFGRLSKREQLSPVWEGWKDFESFRQRTRLVSRQEKSDPEVSVASPMRAWPIAYRLPSGDSLCVHLDDFWVQTLSRVRRTLLFLVVHALCDRAAFHFAENQIGESL